MKCWNDGRMERWNVEAIAEIPLRRENVGRMECWNIEAGAEILLGQGMDE